jgi:voltage-gated potassium channel
MNNPFHSLRKVLILFSFILFGGTLGYRLIEDLDWLPAFYMVVQTVSTVGFNEVTELSTSGTWFTIVLIISALRRC